jgi:type II secretory pathway pseudopilin PulG
MKLTHLSVGLIILGLLLMASSLAWPYIVQSTGGIWTEQQALEHAKNAADLHRIVHESTHTDDLPPQSSQQGDPTINDANYIQAKARYQQSEAQLQIAQFWSQGVAEWIKWFGAACSLLGIIGFYYFHAKST